MLSVASVVAVAEVEGLRAIRGPLSFIVEGSGVPDNFVHELRDADGVRSWAVAADAQESSRSVHGMSNM